MAKKRELKEPESQNKLLLFIEIIGDLLTAVAHFVMGIISSSAAMMAEGFHSLADTSNQVALLLGVENSRKSADDTHPFGYGKDRFFWSFISALFIMLVSGGIAVWQGINKIITQEEVSNLKINLLVLGIALVFQCINLFFSNKRFRAVVGKIDSFKTLIKKLKLIKEPTVMNLWLGDIAGTGGKVLAGIAIIMVMITGNPVYDGVASVIIGVVLVVLGVFLAKDSRDLLIGEAVTPAMYTQIKSIIRSFDEVEDVLSLKTMHLTPEEILINADIKFKEDLGTRQIEKTIDKIEYQIKENIPSATQIFLEAEDNSS